MGFLASMVGARDAESKGMSTLELFKQVFGTNSALTGDSITWKTALQVSTVLACARVIAEGIAQVPLKLFRESPDGLSRTPAKDHPLYRLLSRRPNPWQSSFEWRETVGLHLVLAGRHYSFINRLGNKIVELIPIEPQYVTVTRAPDWTLSYTVRGENGGEETYPAETILHLRGPSWNGWQGLEAIQLIREAIGLSIATERAHALLHKNGVSPSGTWSVEGSLNETQYKALRDHIVRNNTGDNRSMPMIVDRGAKWLAQAMSGVDAQHVETRKHQVEEVCRALRVMPIMVGHSDKTATYASAEQMFLAHVVHTLTPWCTRIEQAIDVQLLTEKDLNEGLYANFALQGLMRGAMKDRGEYFARALGAGGSPAWMTQDEIRGLEELNPMGGSAAALPIPTNVGGAQDAPTPDQVAKDLRFSDMEHKLAALERQKPPEINVTLNQEPVAITVAPSPVNVKGGDINVQAPKAPEVTVNSPEVKVHTPVQVDIHAPPAELKVAPPPNVQIDVHVPPQPAPVVQNTVNLPPQPAPSVTLEATLPPLDISVTLPPRRTKSETDITRDASGNIVKSLTNSTETDA